MPEREQQTAIEVVLDARPENVALARQAAAGAAHDLGAGDDLIDDVRTAVSEAVSNCVQHAYPGGGGPVELTLTEADGVLEISVRDHGLGIRPEPTDPDDPSLRVGFALIGALATGMRIETRQGLGTEIAMSFDLTSREAEERDVATPVLAAGETGLLIGASRPSRDAIARTLELIAARSEVPVDRLTDVHLIADFLSDWNASVAYDGQPLKMGVIERNSGLELKVGPLEPGIAERMLTRAEIEGGGNALKSAADSYRIEREELAEGGAEWLMLAIGPGE